MSQEQQDAELGKLIRQKKETGQRLAALTKEAKEIGMHLVNIGNALQGPIEAIAVNPDGTPVTNPQKFLIVRKIIDIETLRKLVADYMSEKSSLERIEQNLKALGGS
jgi:hypothetical protein